MHEIRAKRGDGEDLTLIVTSTPLGSGLVLETYRDVTAESRVQRKYHALLARERGAKEDLERKVLERTEALRRAQDQLVLNEKMSSLGGSSPASRTSSTIRSTSSTATSTSWRNTSAT